MAVKLFFINGPSSSGKSSVSKAMASVSLEEFFVYSLDEQSERRMQLGVSNDDPLEDLIEMATEVADMLALGRSVIVDAVAFPNALSAWMNVLKMYNPFVVGIMCDEETLNAREKSRGDRQIGSASCQMKQMDYRTGYDYIIHTNNNTDVVPLAISVLNAENDRLNNTAQIDKKRPFGSALHMKNPLPN